VLAEWLGALPSLRPSLTLVAALSALTAPPVWAQSVSFSFADGPARETTTLNGQTVVNTSSMFGYTERRTVALQDLDPSGIHTETAADRSVSALVLRCKDSKPCVERAGYFDGTTQLPDVAHTHRDESMSMRCTPADCAKLVSAVRASAPRSMAAAGDSTYQRPTPQPQAALQAPTRPAPTEIDGPAPSQENQAVQNPPRVLTPAETAKYTQFLNAGQHEEAQKYLNSILGTPGNTGNTGPAGTPPDPPKPPKQPGIDGQEIPERIDFNRPSWDGGPAPVVPQVQIGLDGKPIPSEIVFKRPIVGSTWDFSVEGKHVSVTLSDGTRGTAVWGTFPSDVTWQLREQNKEKYIEIHAADPGGTCMGNWTIRGKLEGPELIVGNFDYHVFGSCSENWRPGVSAREKRPVPVRAFMK